MRETKLHYDNYIFDLYGTLIDIRTDEEDINAWEKMALLYRYYGAVYEAEELRETYVSAVCEALDASWAEHSGGARTGIAGVQAAETPRDAAWKSAGIPRTGISQTPGKVFRGTDTSEIRIETVFRRLYEDKGIHPDEELVLWTCRIFRIVTTVYIRLFPQVKERMRDLHENGARIYLLTNAQRVFTENELRIFGLEPYFDGILMSSDVYFKKPDRRFYQRLIDTYGLDPSRCLMSGDDAVCDVAGARNAGMDGFLVKHTPARRKGQDSGSDMPGHGDGGSICHGEGGCICHGEGGAVGHRERKVPLV